MPVQMSTKMIELLIKIENKHTKCHIFKLPDVIKLFWNKYVRKNAFRTEEHILGGRLCPRGAAHYLCTYHIPSVRTIKRNQSEPIGTIPFSLSFTNFRFQSKSDLTIPAIFDSDAFARTKQFLIRMKIRAQSNYQTIFDSN